MKKLQLTLFLSFFTLHAICQTIISGKVIRVADGDTITILDSLNKQTRIRLYGIDCPEKGQDFSNVAKKFTADQCYDKQVKVKVNYKDRYRRTVGIVILQNGAILNEELLKAGLAWHYKQHDQSERFAQAEDFARLHKIGLWIQPKAIAPWKYRKMRR